MPSTVVITSQHRNTRISLDILSTCLNWDFQHPARLAFSVPTSLQSSSTGILTCLPSATLLSLTLGADSPCADYRRAGNLRLSACGFFSRIIVTHVSIRTSDTSSMLFNTPSQAYRTLLYHLLSDKSDNKSVASVDSFSPLHLPRKPTRPVSYYAFFKGWLLLSQPPGCLGLLTSFST